MTQTPYAPPPQPVPPATPPPKSSSGCLKWGLIGCGILLVLFVAFCAVVGIFVFGAMKRSHVYKEALQRAQSDPRVIAALGSPVEGGWWVKGNVHFDSDKGGNAELTFPISGPKQKGELHAVATYENDRWRYETLTVKPESGPLIDLNTPP